MYISTCDIHITVHPVRQRRQKNEQITQDFFCFPYMHRFKTNIIIRSNF